MPIDSPDISRPSAHIGLFFGSFNPVHVGHLQIADYMLSHVPMDELWWVVSPNNPLKKHSDLLDDRHRLQMVELAIAGRRRMRTCDIEFFLSKPSYTIHTLDSLTEKYPAYRFSLILGSDCLDTFDQWKQADEIIRRFHRYIYPRPGTPEAQMRHLENADVVHAPEHPVSSTAVRARIRQHLPIRDLVPDPVEQYIQANKLYL